MNDMNMLILRLVNSETVKRSGDSGEVLSRSCPESSFRVPAKTAG